MSNGFAAVLCFTAFAPALSGQQRVDLRNTYERLLIVCPMRGAGTHADPRRPLYAPAAASRDGIVAFTYQLSDDGETALVELVARDRKAFAAILADKRADVKVFEKGKAKKDDIEREFQKHKRGFKLDDFKGVAVP